MSISFISDSAEWPLGPLFSLPLYSLGEEAGAKYSLLASWKVERRHEVRMESSFGQGCRGTDCPIDFLMTRSHSWHRSIRVWGVLAFFLCLSFGAGCSSLKCKSFWIDGGGCSHPLHYHRLSWNAFNQGPDTGSDALDPLQMARARFSQAETLSDWNSPDCVDDFYAAALWGWYAGAANEGCEARELVNNSLARLLHESQAHGRLDLRRGLEVRYAGESRLVPVEMIGYPWPDLDYQELRVVGRYFHVNFAQYHHQPGLGVPVVLVRRQPMAGAQAMEFLPNTAAFPATAVLTPDGSAIRLYDPLRVQRAQLDGIQVELARDTTADLAYALHHHPQTRIQDFLRPDRSQDPAELFFVEPYQSNKIPVVFVHGLLSSPDAWANILNELRTYPDIVDTYQFWAFKYATGAPFVRSAAELRSYLNLVLERYDCSGTNDNLRRAVLVGHSMGGLISKLTIAHSGENVWDAIANIPMESLAADELTRSRLIERFYFDPHPMIGRAIFIATPHQGSSTAGRACGKLASAMVHADNSMFEHLLDNNPGAFKPDVASGLPTSIDMLDPNQPFLATLDSLPLRESVPKHTILGNKYHMLGHHPSDGVVSVTSAQHPDAISEKRIAASHNGLLKSQETVYELVRILRLHAEDVRPTSVAAQTDFGSQFRAGSSLTSPNANPNE